MSINRYAKKRDSNHRAICDAFKQAGCSVFEPDQVDAVVGYNHRNYVFEIKPKGKRKRLQPSQQHFLATWRGQYHVIESFEEGFNIIKNDQERK
jgi:hypothetical protein